MIGKLSELQKEKNEQCTQRHELAVERLRTIVTEETVNAAYISYFQDCTLFLLELENTRKKLEDGSWDSLSLEEKRSLNRILYSDIIGEKYQTSYANQDYACEKLGQEMGQLLSLLYTEIRAGIPYVFEQRKDYLTILYELFLEVYTCFEGMSEEENPVPKPEQIKEILYWYAAITAMYFMQTEFWSRWIRQRILQYRSLRRQILMKMIICMNSVSTFPRMNLEQLII